MRGSGFAAFLVIILFGLNIETSSNAADGRKSSGCNTSPEQIQKVIDAFSIQAPEENSFLKSSELRISGTCLGDGLQIELDLDSQKIGTSVCKGEHWDLPRPNLAGIEDGVHSLKAKISDDKGQSVVRKHKIILNPTITCADPITSDTPSTSEQVPRVAQTQVQAYENYLKSNLCDFAHGKKELCFRPVEEDFQGSPVQDLYVWVQTVDDWNFPAGKGISRAHLFLNYLKKLRNAALENKKYLDRLNRQLDFILQPEIAPHRNGAIVVETEEGYSHAMIQQEFANFFYSMAQSVQKLEPENIDLRNHYYDLMFAFAKALDLPVGKHSGGVRSPEIICGPEQKLCWFFHSRGLPQEEAGSALNQSFHALRDTFVLYEALIKTPDFPLPAGFQNRQEVLDHLLDRVRGGLDYLAYAPGWSAPGWSSKLPPNLQEYMNLRSVKNTNYYWAFYEYDLTEGKGRNIKAATTCNYHTHVLEVAAGLFKPLLQSPNVSESLKETARRLLASETDENQIETLGAAKSHNALFQFFMSEIRSDIRFGKQNCPCNPLTKDASLFYMDQFYSKL